MARTTSSTPERSSWSSAYRPQGSGILGLCPSGATLRRRGSFVREGVRKPSFRCQSGAGGRISYGIPSETIVRASFWHRGAPFVRDRFDNSTSGVNLAPDGTSRTGFRRKPLFGRHFLARGLIPDSNACRKRPSGERCLPEGPNDLVLLGFSPSAMPCTSSEECRGNQRTRAPCSSPQRHPTRRWQRRPLARCSSGT